MPNECDDFGCSIWDISMSDARRRKENRRFHPWALMDICTKRSTSPPLKTKLKRVRWLFESYLTRSKNELTGFNGDLIRSRTWDEGPESWRWAVLCLTLYVLFLEVNSWLL